MMVDENKFNNDLTQEYLKSIYNYDPETGIFTSITTLKTIGYFDGKKKYLRTEIKNKSYALHRLAWLYMTGEWPKDQIDHIDNNTTNNKWLNLREASNQENRRNTKVQPNNKLGVKGVSICKKSKKYKAQITINKKVINLGRFSTIEEAKNAYTEKAKEFYGEFFNNG